MSDQTTANNPQQPVLCKNGCGFFGNAATGGCCSKCFREKQKKEEQPVVSTPAKPEPVDNYSPEKPAPMEVEESTQKPEREENILEVVQPVVETPKKRKKKKASYKNMMAGMMKSTSPTRDADKEKEVLRKVTGGGTFSKIEKI